MDTKPEAATSMSHLSVPAAARPTLDTILAKRNHHDEESSGGSGDEMKIDVIVKMVGATGDMHLNISEDATVFDLKVKIKTALKIRKIQDVLPPDRQRLIFMGRMLTKDEDFLVDDVNMIIDGPNYVHLAPIPHGVGPSLRRDRNDAAALSEVDEDDVDDIVDHPFLRFLRRTVHRRQRSREARRVQASPYGSPFGGHDALHGRSGHLPPSHENHSLLSNAPVSGTASQWLAETSPATMGVSARMPCQAPMSHPSAYSGTPLSVDAIGLATSAPVPHMVSASPELSLEARQANSVARDAEMMMLTREMIPLYHQVLPQQLVQLVAYTPTSPQSEHQYLSQLESTANLLEHAAHRGLVLADALRQVRTERQVAASLQAHAAAVAVASVLFNNSHQVDEDPREDDFY